MNSANHVLIVISSLGGGGAERVVTDLASYLVEVGRQVTVLTLNGDDPDAYALPASITRERIEIRRPAASLFHSLRFTLDHLLRMRNRIRSIGPDIVVSFMDQVNVRIAVCTLHMDLPLVLSERAHPQYAPLSHFWRKSRFFCYRTASIVVVQTEQIASWFRANVPVRQLAIIPNAVRHCVDYNPHRSWSDIALEQKYIVGVGRLVPQKGFDLLISAFAASRLTQKGYKLVILGEGQERRALEKQVRSRGLVKSVLLPGHVENVTEWLLGAQLFVLSSRYEGFPNVLLEAMQLGVPSISFDCPSGPSEIISNEKDGLLVPVENITALSDALVRLADDRGLREKFSLAATSVNEYFSPQKIYGQWLEVIDAAYQRRRR